MRCPDCHGKGKITVSRYRYNRLMDTKINCVKCKGTGEVADPPGNNSTPWPLDLIRSFTLLFRVKNEWRQRMVEVYQHPTNPGQVVSVGVPFTCADTAAIIAAEDRSGFPYPYGPSKVYLFK